MKRNHPPDRNAPAALVEQERRIIEERLDELYSTRQVRKVLKTNRATYLEDRHHVRLDAAQITVAEPLRQYSRELGYYYLNPYQALYLLESRHILIFYNELQLSLAEAYKLLLKDKGELQKYLVFAHLNRNGFNCLEPSPCRSSSGRSSLKDGTHADHNEQKRISTTTDEQPDCKTLQPLFEIDSPKLQAISYNEVLGKLSDLGPQYHESGGEELDAKQQDNSTTISFEAYKRETFARNKPRRDKVSKPDYFVVVCDKNVTTSPSPMDFTTYGESCICNKLLFALVDSDASISFVQFESIDVKNDLHPAGNEWPEKLTDRKLSELKQTF